MGTVIDEKHYGQVDRHQRWDRFQRAALLEQYGALQAQGLSQRQAATQLEVPAPPCKRGVPGGIGLMPVLM